MKRTILTLTMAVVAVLLVACGNKKKSETIIAQRVVKATPGEPVRMQEYTDRRDVKWVEGRAYQVSLHRQPADSLPMVKDETGQKFVDNSITLAVTRQDGSVFFSKTFTKGDFVQYVSDDYRRTGILEGLVFDRVDGDWLEFAASVSHPQTDEYIPLIVRLSRMGVVTVQQDTQLDTNARSEEDDV